MSSLNQIIVAGNNISAKTCSESTSLFYLDILYLLSRKNSIWLPESCRLGGITSLHNLKLKAVALDDLCTTE